jgi:hypothetical protein
MAIDVLNTRGTGKEDFGKALSTGIGNLAHLKMQQVTQTHHGNVLKQLGLNPVLAQLPAQERELIIKSGGGGLGNGTLQGTGNGIGGNGFRGQTLSLRQQAQINSANRGFNADNDKAYRNALTAKDEIQNMREALATGKVYTGAKGQFIPSWAQNTETQLFDKSSNTLAGLLASGQGVPSGFKIKFAQSQKPNISQTRAAQEKLLDKIEAEVDKAIMRNDIRDAIIEQNGGEQPPNLSALVNRAMNAGGIQKNNNEPQEHNPRSINAFEAQKKKPQTPEQPTKEYNTEDENLLGWGARQAVRSGARIAGAAAGGLGDIASAGLGLANYVTNGKLPELEKAQDYLPTSQKIAEKLDKWSSGYTKPQNGVESVADDILGTFGSIFAPGAIVSRLPGALAKAGATAAGAARVTKGAKVLLPFSGVIVPARTAMKMAVAGEIGSKGAEALGGGAIPQTIAKMAFMAGAATKGTRAIIEKDAAHEWASAEKAFAPSKGGIETEIVKMARTEKALAKIKHQQKFQAVAHGEEVEKIVKLVDDVLNASPKNTIYGPNGKALEGNALLAARDAVKMDKNLQIQYALTERPRIPGEKSLQKSTKEYVKKLFDAVQEDIKDFKSQNEIGVAHWAQAKDMSRGLLDASEATKFFNKVAGLHTFKAQTTLDLVKLFAKAPGLGVLQISRMKDLFKTYPQARTYYWDAIKAATNNNKAAYIQNMAKIDQLALKMEKKD